MKFISSLFAIFLIISSFPALAHSHPWCKIKDQNGSLESSWCDNHHQKGSWRCYAMVEYEDGVRGKKWSNVCADSFFDCEKNREFSFEPECAIG